MIYFADYFPIISVFDKGEHVGSSGEALRPSGIHKCLPEAATRVLDIQLKEMVEDGLVVKTIYPELPPRSEYVITYLGKSLLPIIDSMLKWGEEHLALFEKKYAKKN